MNCETRAAGLWGRLETLKQNTASFDRWMRTPWYVLALAVLTVISNLLGLDLGMFTLLIGLGIYISLLGSDLLPLMPVFILFYVAPSRENNPGRYPESVFYPQNGGIFLIVLLLLWVACLVWRLVKDPEFGGKGFLRTKRCLLPSMLLLGASYLLSGIGMDEYFSIMGRNLVFALIQCFAVMALYYLFTGSVRWDRAPRGYLAWTGLAVGFIVLVQLLENYLSGRIFENGTINRELIATGWGMHNNVGCMMAMMMPFAFYLAAKSKRGWLFNLLGTVLFLGTALSCSRGSMLMAGLAYGLCAFLLLKNPESRKKNLKVYLIALGAVVVGVVILAPKLLSVFRLFLSQLGNVSQRDNLLYYGICQFLDEPVFGGSFFPQGSYVPWDWANLEAFSSFFPPRWHNTLVQMLASCGTLGITAYLIHRCRTVQLFRKCRSVEHTFVAVSLGVLLCAALLDCHFFNVGPVLFYSMALAFAEKLPEA
jgi:hypothetical protein